MSLTAEETKGLLRQAMKSKGDFPAVSSALQRILGSMEGDDCSDEQMVNLVLSDFALTQKVLRLANSAMYSTFGAVTTVSMAVYVLGTETVGHLAMGLKLLDNLGQAADTARARQELAKSVVAGAVARNIGTSVSGRDGEALAVATLIRGLGKLLVCFYLPDQFAEIDARHPSMDDEDEHAREVLGLTYGELAFSVVAEWKLPEELRTSVSGPCDQHHPHNNWVHAVANYARRYVSAVAEGQSEDELAAIASRYAEAIGATQEDLLRNGQLAVVAQKDEEGAVPAFMGDASATERRGQAKSGSDHLREGLAELESALTALRPAQVLSLATEVLWKGLEGARLMFFVRNRHTATFDLVVGRGEGMQAKIRKVRFEEAFSPNVFHFALAKDMPVYLNDVFEPNIARRLPEWLKEAVPPARTIFLLPFSLHGHPTGILYLDWGREGRLRAPSKEEMALVERVRHIVCRALGSICVPAATPVAA